MSAEEFAREFDPSMIGRVLEVTLILSRHTGVNYYNSEIEDVKTTKHGGRLAEYGERSFTFAAVGTAAPTVVTWPAVASGWPDNRFRVEIRLAPEPIHSRSTEDE